TATAVSTDGTVDQQATELVIVETPEWAEAFELQNIYTERGIATYRREFTPGGDNSSEPTEITDGFPFEDVTMPAVGEEQQSEVTLYMVLTVDLATSDARATVGGETKYSVSVIVVSGEVRGSAYADLRKGDLTDGRLHARATAAAQVPPRGIPNPPVGPVPPNVVNLYPIFEVELTTTSNFDEVDNNTSGVAFEFRDGVVSPRLEARQEVGKKYSGTELVLGLEEGIDTEMPISDLSTVNGTVYGQLYARALLYGYTAGVSYPRGSDRFTYQFSDVGGDVTLSD
ncbi:hypothetical protein, partial [Haloferax profundi]|uniref:hypothetical protein n=1 Tax=Haloferax profundi TaxID=1544718 RepID=UPI000AF325B9